MQHINAMFFLTQISLREVGLEIELLKKLIN